MAKTKMVFQRLEKKYIITQEQKKAVSGKSRQSIKNRSV